MNYTKIQKIIASILLPFFFFGITFRIPSLELFNSLNAWNTKLFSLVSILVNKDIYNNIKAKLERYANDISKQLDNTKVVIIPTPNNASAFKIASLNEKLFFEWYKWIKNNTNFESRLVGTILVWNFNLPIVYKNNQSTKSIVPYVDFIDKYFIYDHKTKKYKFNTNNRNWLKAEIWHWVISPNFWDKQKNIEALNNYFDKSHNFYTWEWNFQTKNNIINWNPEEKNPQNYKPYVFYFDQFREEKSLSYAKYLWYKAYLENKEDIVYHRYSKSLADKIKNSVLSPTTKDIKKLVKEINPSFSYETKNSWPDIKNTPDILTKTIIDKVSKNFIETINSSKIWEFRKNVNNAGRYSYSWSVNADLVPYFISALDSVEDWIIKWVNKTLEEKINNLVIKEGLSRKIIIPTKIHYKNSYWNLNNTYNCNSEYENILYWKQAKNINSAKECSIYLWNNKNWWQLVEANRW